MPIKNVVLALFAIALFTGGIVSWFASENPDGLEWSIAKVTGSEYLEGEKAGVHGALAGIQEKLAFLPDYSFKKPEVAKKEEAKPAVGIAAAHQATPEVKEEKTEEGGKLGTSVSGVIGGLITLAMAFGIGFALKRRARAQ